MAARQKGPGARRADDFELKQEEAIFDVVNDVEYTAIVAERRNKYGDFVVEDGGAGYVDIGEEDDWNVDYYKDEREREEREERDAEDAANKKRKQSKEGGAGGSKGKKKKSKQQASLLSDALNQNKKLNKMFLAATAAGPKRGGLSLGQTGSAQAGKNVDGQSDALLEDILGDLDCNVGGEDLRARPVQGEQGNPFSRPRARRPAAASPASTREMSSRPQPSVPRMAAVARPAVKEQESCGTENVMDEADPCDLNIEPEAEDQAPLPAQAKAENDGGHLPQKQEEPQKQESAGVADEDAPMKSAWETMCEDEVEVNVCADAGAAASAGDSTAAAMDVEGSQEVLDFYFLDLHSENSVAGSMKGSVCMFGKMRDGKGGWQSCSVIVGNMQRNVFFVPRPEILSKDADSIEELEQKVAEGDKQARGELMRLLHGKLADLKDEVRSILTSRGVTKFTLVPVKRDYAFEVAGVPKGMQWVIKVKYSAQLPELAESETAGEHFCGMFGAKTSISEHLILKRKLKGPGWLKVSNPSRVPQERQITWSKQEYQVDSPKLVSVSEEAHSHPPLTVAAVNLKTYVAPNQTTPEIISCTVMYLKQVQTDLPTPKDQWNTLRQLRHFSCVRRLEGQPFPVGFERECQQRNASNVGKLNNNSVISHFNSERALLCNVVARLKALDPDVLVGHNVLAFDLDVMYRRMIHLKVPHWSRLGRMKRSQMPYGTDKKKSSSFGNTLVGSTITTGRLVCDTYLSAREFVRQSDYSLKALSRELLGETKVEMSSSLDMSSVFYSAKDLFQLVTLAEQDAWLSLGLMFHLSVLPLTRQLTNLSGFQWAKVLRGGRAQRIEYLLLHEFHGRKFIVPDKKQYQSGKGADKSKKAKYAGGLVLDPKAGLYDDIVMMLDFNSLYPSIIQEYNICFTTVDRPEVEGEMAQLPEPNAEGELAVLPSTIRGLVQRRREVKRMLKEEKEGAKRQQLDIRQQALKLTANSMYGCLGFSASRFCAKPLAELVTQQGREILQSTANLAEQNLGISVVYGDTDSIFVNTRTKDLDEVKRVGNALRREVNKRYKLLEIEIDAIFYRLLLLKKKKYAAIKLEPNGSGGYDKVVEHKGIDIVRRDWSLIAKECGRRVLDLILGEKDKDEMAEEVLQELTIVGEKIRSGSLGVGKFAITKQLTKDPEAYPDAKNQAHVQVALRRKKAGRREGVSAGETVAYVIGEGDGALAERALGLEEMAGRKVDYSYYLESQVLPVVGRLITGIEGLSVARLASALGLSADKYHEQERLSGRDREDEAMLGGGGLMKDYKNCSPLPSMQGLSSRQVRNRVQLLVHETTEKGYDGAGQGEDWRQLFLQLSSWREELSAMGEDGIGGTQVIEDTLSRSAFNFVPSAFFAQFAC